MYSRYEVIRLLSSPKKLFAATVHKKATAYTWRKQQENKLPNAIYTPFHCHLRKKIGKLCSSLSFGAVLVELFEFRVALSNKSLYRGLKMRFFIFFYHTILEQHQNYFFITPSFLKMISTIKTYFFLILFLSD